MLVLQCHLRNTRTDQHQLKLLYRKQPSTDPALFVCHKQSQSRINRVTVLILLVHTGATGTTRPACRSTCADRNMTPSLFCNFRLRAGLLYLCYIVWADQINFKSIHRLNTQVGVFHLLKNHSVKSLPPPAFINQEHFPCDTKFIFSKLLTKSHEVVQFEKTAYFRKFFKNYVKKDLPYHPYI